MWGFFMRKDNFFKESLLLTISNLSTGVLGFIFSILLSKELGPEGMGLYGLVMPIYNLFICLICGGMVTAISKVAAIYYGKSDYRNLHRTIKTTIVFDLILGITIASLFYLLTPFISKDIIKDARTLNSLKIIAPALVFVALSSILKGFFYGTSNVKIPAFIDILEKGVRIAVIVTLINMLKTPSINNTVTVAYIALCIGEFVSLLLLSVFYEVDKKGIPYAKTKREGRPQLLFNVLVISLPLCLNGFLSTVLSTISTLIVPRRLISAGLQYSTALSLIGKFSGMAMTIIFFPLLVINSIATILVPDLSKALDRKDYYALESRIVQVIKIAFLLGMSTFVIGISIPDSLGKLFFNRSDLGPYIKFAACSAPIAFTSSTTFGILNGLGRQGILLRNSLIVSVLEVVLLYIFTGISFINIFGYGITLIITSIILLIINIYEIRKYCNVSFYTSELIIYLMITLLIYFVINIINNLISNDFLLLKNITIIIFSFSAFFLSISIIKEESQI